MGQPAIITKSSPDEYAMRKVINPQMQLGELDIASIKLDLKSRDDIPQILRGLQHIYTTPEVRGQCLPFWQRCCPNDKLRERSSSPTPITVVLA